MGEIIRKYGLRSFFEVEMLNNALMAGMSADEFWFGDPELYYNYMHILYEKQKLEQQNIWQVGVRVCQALQSTLVLSVPILDGKSVGKIPEYPECPYTDTSDGELTEAQKNLYREQLKMKLEAWAKSYKEQG